MMQFMHGNSADGFKDMTSKISSEKIDLKERRTSNASLQPMHPVASGDNVTLALSSSHKLKEDLPPLIPCCEGKELQISEDLVRSGLSAISVKHESLFQCVSMSRTSDYNQPVGLVKHRNSFRCLQRPDLKRVPYLRRMTPDELELLFRGYADIPTNRKYCEIQNDASGPILQSEQARKTHHVAAEDANIGVQPVTESSRKKCLEDVPTGMRLHGARARLYTSVLAGSIDGNQLGNSKNEEYDIRVPDEVLQGDEDHDQMAEELQIILPFKGEDVVTPNPINN